MPGQLPLLQVSDFGPALEHVADSYHNGKVLALLHKADPARLVLPRISFPPADPYTYVFVHGGEEVTRFENLAVGTHEIAVSVMAQFIQKRAEFKGVKR